VPRAGSAQPCDGAAPVSGPVRRGIEDLDRLVAPRAATRAALGCPSSAVGPVRRRLAGRARDGALRRAVSSSSSSLSVRAPAAEAPRDRLGVKRPRRTAARRRTVSTPSGRCAGAPHLCGATTGRGAPRERISGARRVLSGERLHAAQNLLDRALDPSGRRGSPPASRQPDPRQTPRTPYCIRGGGRALAAARRDRDRDRCCESGKAAQRSI